MSNPIDPAPFNLADLVSPALDSIVRAVSDRGNQTDAERREKAGSAMDLILSFRPADVAELMLSGQTVLFHELLADGARDALRGVPADRKPRCHSGLVSMGRLLQGHLDRLEKRGNQPMRVDVSAEENGVIAPDAAVVVISVAVVAATSEVARAAVVPDAVDISDETLAEAERVLGALSEIYAGDKAAAFPEPTPAADAATESSWLDEPFAQWVIETQGDRVWAQGAMVTPQSETARFDAARAELTRAEKARTEPTQLETALAETTLAETALAETTSAVSALAETLAETAPAVTARSVVAETTRTAGDGTRPEVQPSARRRTSDWTAPRSAVLALPRQSDGYSPPRLPIDAEPALV